METFIIATALLGLGSSFLLSAKGPQQFLFALAAILLLLIPSWGMEGEETKVMLSLCVMIAIGFASGFLKKYALIPAIAVVFLPLVLLMGKESVYLGFELKWNLKLVLLPLLGAAIPLLGQLKAIFLAKWLEVKKENVESAVSALITAVVVLFATFQAQYFGVFLVGAGWLTVLLAQRQQARLSGPFGLFAVGLAFLLMKQNSAVDDSFLRGNFLMGVLAGAGALKCAVLFVDAGRLKWIFAYLVPLIFVTVIVFLGLINAPFGGMPAFAGVLIGAGAVGVVSGKGSTVLPLLLMICGLTVPVQAKFAAKEEVKSTRFTEETVEVLPSGTLHETEEQAESEAVATTPAKDSAGSWKALVSKSSVTFELGPEGSVTKGAVKDFDVTLEIDNEGTLEKLNVTIPVNKVTTFEAMRDETIIGPDFLDSDAFPKAQFQSTSVVKQGETYLVKGYFTLLGKKKPMILKVRFVGSGEEKSKPYLLMTGTTQFDRTTYGMESDPSIGDVVTVSWELELNRK